MSLPATLALDTNCFIYLFEEEDSPRSAFLEREVFRPSTHGGRHLVTSTLTVAELLVVPFRSGHPDRARSVSDALRSLDGLEILELDHELAEDAARLRAQHGVALPDAIQLATATKAADALLTNDARLARGDHGVPVLVLDELL
jgi:predicted nucleic acid-binding protein